MSDMLPTVSTPDGSSSAAPSNALGDRQAHREQPRIRRRNRLIASCLECRRRKLKCDKLQPCTNCIKFARPCVFIASGLDPDAQAKLAEVKEKMGMLEKTLEDDVTRRVSTARSSKSPSREAPVLPGQELGHSDQEEEEDAKDLDFATLAVEDAAYYEDDGNDDLVDLGVSLGKLRITERIGGLVRPKFSEELAQALKQMPETDVPSPYAGQSQQSWMSPGSDYVAPASSFFFGEGAEKTSLATYLPSKALSDKLLAHYWQAVHLIARTVHRPSFERQYEFFWRNLAAGFEPRASFQAVVFAALLSSSISMSEHHILDEFGVDKQSLVENFRQGTEAALARANFLRTTKLETLQAFVMYLIPLCRGVISRAHSALTGTCIRLAECMSLHRDPTSYSTNAIEIHMRRLIWYQICFLDMRTCEATGPRPQIRRDEYDTRFPLNVEDAELDRAVEQGKVILEDSKHFTDMTITRMRFETYEMFRVIWTERPKLQRRSEKGEKKTTLTSLLSRIQAFKAAMEKTYLPMLSKNNPRHVMAIEIYGILSSRLYVTVLHPYASDDKRIMPERLSQMMMSSSIMVLEHSRIIEEQPALAQWSWYLGALHQFQTVLLFFSEMYTTKPEPEFLARIWRCIDYTFELSPDGQPADKARHVLEELVARTGAYAIMRRMRAPMNMPSAGPRKMVTDKGKVTQQQNQTEGDEFRERSSSVHSSTSGHTTSAVPQIQPQYSTMQQQQPQSQQQYNARPLRATGPLGAIPQVDWGSIDMATTNIQAAPPLVSGTTGTYDFGGFAPTSAAPNLLASVNASAGSDSSSPPGTYGVGGGSSGIGTSATEMAIDDIDWNEWDQLFGNAQMGAGNILIPPFTFPQLEPSDLQWLNPDSVGGAGSV